MEKMKVIIPVLIFFCFITGLFAGAQQVSLPLPEWEFKSRGNFIGRIDRRNLYQIVHPFEAAKAGDYGRIERDVKIPAGMNPPYFLRFYVSDNIYGEVPPRVVDLRKGHRFKEVLIDGKTVWSQDIFFNTPLSDPEYTWLDITSHVKEKRSFRLSFQVRQDVDSSRSMEGDIVKTGVYAGTTRPFLPLPREKYSTWSYWGDFALYSGGRPEKQEVAPFNPELRVKEPQLLYRGKASVNEKRDLRIEKQELLGGGWSWPVSQGIPLPMGALKDVSSMMLAGPEGKNAAAAFTPLNRWPDGSLKWVLMETLLHGRAKGPYRLHYGSGVKAPAFSVKNPVSSEKDILWMQNGLINARWTYKDGKPDSLSMGFADGQTLVSGPEPYMLFSKNKVFKASWNEGKWLSVSPQRAEMEVSGELLAADGDRYGSCRLRIAMHSGVPLLRILYTIVNERSEAVPEDEPDKERVRATGGLVGGTRPLTALAKAYGLKFPCATVDIRQDKHGWISAETDSGFVTGGIRYYEHIMPVGLAAGKDGLDFQLFKPGDPEKPFYGSYPGEAHTHEIWLALTKERPGEKECLNLSRLAETPPRFDTSGMIRDSYAWGEMPSVNEQDNPEVYTILVEKVLAPYYADTLEGIRYYGGYSRGLNFYWNGLDSMYKLYAMTGERKWYDWAERSIRHYMDVCTIHWSADGSKVGAKNRSVDKFLALYLVHQNPHPLFDHWNMTGDPDGFRLGTANADLLITDENFVMLTEQRADRQQGWPLMAMVRALQETGYPRYRKHAERIVDIVLGYMEKRRGAYLRVHGSSSHMGIVPFMSGILASGLKDYHFWTGDERAGKVVVQVAESVYAEMHDPYHSKTLPDIDYYYSPNPYLRGRDGKTLTTHLNLNIVAAQAYAAYLTNDPGLADIAWRSWRAYIQGGSWGTLSYMYSLHAALYWLEKAPVPDRSLDVEVNLLWRYETAAREVWLNLPEKSPLRLRVRWTVYEQPFQRGQKIEAWETYAAKKGLKGKILLLDGRGREAASVPLDFAGAPNGTYVEIAIPAAEPGFYRLVTRGAECAPVQLILQDVFPRKTAWGVPVDRGYLNGGSEYFFHVPEGLNELEASYTLLAPWEKAAVALLDETGMNVTDEKEAGASTLEWKVDLKPEYAGRVWSFRHSGTSNVLLRIKGVHMVGLKEESLFLPARVPPPVSFSSPPRPRGFTGNVVNLPSGEVFRVARGEESGEGRYQNVNAGEGTIEFWMRLNTEEEKILSLSLLSFGKMHLYHRGGAGTYFSLDKGLLQSGFIFLPDAWYHVALTWDLGNGGRKPSMNLFVDGVSMMGRMQTSLPADTGDWTGSELRIGGKVPFSIAGLRIHGESMEKDTEQGLSLTGNSKNILYSQ